MQRALAIALVSACGAAPPPVDEGGPRGPRATDHIAEAHRHEEAERQRTSWPDTRSAGPTDPPVGVWVRSFDSVEHERMASIHKSRAAAMDAEFAEACAGLSGEDITVSPLKRLGLGGWNTAAGAIVYLKPHTASPDKLLAQIRCHRAWMMLGPSDMEDCPLDLPGLAIDARGDETGVTVSLVVRDPKLVAELQRRTAKDLEAAASMRR